MVFITFYPHIRGQKKKGQIWGDVGGQKTLVTRLIQKTSIAILLEQDKETTGAILKQLFAQSISEAAAELKMCWNHVNCVVISVWERRNKNTSKEMILFCITFQRQCGIHRTGNAPTRKFPRKTGYCWKCDSVERVESYKDVVNKAAVKPVFTTLEDYINASKIYTTHMEAYCQSLPTYERPSSIFGTHKQSFQKSAFTHSLRQRCGNSLGNALREVSRRDLW